MWLNGNLDVAVRTDTARAGTLLLDFLMGATIEDLRRRHGFASQAEVEAHLRHAILSGGYKVEGLPER